MASKKGTFWHQFANQNCKTLESNGKSSHKRVHSSNYGPKESETATTDVQHLTTLEELASQLRNNIYFLHKKFLTDAKIPPAFIAGLHFTFLNWILKQNEAVSIFLNFLG